ncbi:hypothetical protein G6F32_015269 [Rhizopus arrhizus]|nr:hypothetical protein G6F32_015269 [Rhizopus arrhizus]
MNPPRRPAWSSAMLADIGRMAVPTLIRTENTHAQRQPGSFRVDLPRPRQRLGGDQPRPGDDPQRHRQQDRHPAAAGRAPVAAGHLVAARVHPGRAEFLGVLGAAVRGCVPPARRRGCDLGRNPAAGGDPAGPHVAGLADPQPVRRGGAKRPGRRGAAGADAQGRAGSGGHCRRLGQRRIHGAGHRA